MSDVLQRWRDAQQHLDAAIQAYSDSVAALGCTFQGSANALDADSLDSLVLAAKHDSGLIAQRFEILKGGRAILNAIQNTSPIRVTTNRLPQEVLIQIFGLCAQKYPEYYHDPLLCSGKHLSLPQLFTLGHVCVAWRKMIIETPSFWAHVDMASPLESKNLNNPLQCIQTSLQRASNLPVCLDFDFSPDRAIHDMPAILASNLLWPYLNGIQIHSVYLRNFTEHDVLVAVLSRILQTARAGSVQNLVLWRDDDRFSELFILDLFSGSDNSIPLPPQIGVLRLNNIALPWQSPTYRNLVHLHIGGSYTQVGPRIDELLSILSSCPELHILQLPLLAIQPSNRSQLQSVTLEHLRVLDLMSMPGYSLELLLPQLKIPHSNGLSLRLDTYAPSTTPVYATRAFLARTNVARLYTFAPSPNEQIVLQVYLASARNLSTLILDFNHEQCDTYLNAIANTSVALCPALSSFYLFNATTTETALSEFVRAHPSLDKLSVIDSAFHPFLEGITERLKSLGPQTIEIYSPQTSYLEHAWHCAMP